MRKTSSAFVALTRAAARSAKDENSSADSKVRSIVAGGRGRVDLGVEREREKNARYGGSSKRRPPCTTRQAAPPAGAGAPMAADRRTQRALSRLSLFLLDTAKSLVHHYASAK